MRIDVLTLFPGMFQGPLSESILKRASSFAPPGASEDKQDEEKPIQIHVHDLRKFGLGAHRQVDDAPYGGGAGMVMRADVLVQAIEAVARGHVGPVGQVGPVRIYLSPKGKKLRQTKVESLAKREWLLLLCGHYEGIDQRVIDGGWIDEEISIGDYVLTGGEIPAMVLIDAVARQIPGVLGRDESAMEESFSKATERKREYPHYTRPEAFRGFRVPDVLLSGHHAEIEKWRRSQLL